MGWNKMVLRGVPVFATIALLAGMQIAGASPKMHAAKTTKNAQKQEKKAAAQSRVRLLLSYGTLTADKFAYKYQDDQLLSIHAYGHVKLGVPKYCFTAISSEALFTPDNVPSEPLSLLQLVSSQNGESSCRLAGDVTMGDDAQCQWNEYAMNSDWVNVGWLTYHHGDKSFPDIISYPGGRGGEEITFVPCQITRGGDVK